MEESGTKMAVDKALDAMPKDFTIKKYLVDNRARVVDMLVTEFEEIAKTERAIEEGKKEGIAIGEASGLIKGTVQQLVEFIKDGFITIEEAAKRAGMSLDEFKKFEALYCC